MHNPTTLTFAYLSSIFSLLSCSKTLWGFPLLTRVYGSALPRSLLPALLSGVITLMLLLLRERLQHLWVHPYPYQPLVLIATFVLTFRCGVLVVLVF
jgi:hypothetical protein